MKVVVVLSVLLVLFIIIKIKKNHDFNVEVERRFENGEISPRAYWRWKNGGID